MSQQKKKKNTRADQTRNNLKIAIAVSSGVLAVLLLVGIGLALSDNQHPKTNGPESTNGTGETVPSTEISSDPAADEQKDPASEQLLDGVPTEENPLLLDQELYVVHMGNFTGRYVEDGSDIEVENVCAAVVENRGEKTVQLVQFQITSGEGVYDFSLTTLPPGERAIVQELNRRSLKDAGMMVGKVDVLVFFSEEPGLHEDIFAVSGSENCIELRNLTDADIAGPIYVYYKTRTAEGYAGGITYRLTIPSLKAGETYQAAATHFWVGSSQVMFIDYAA